MCARGRSETSKLSSKEDRRRATERDDNHCRHESHRDAWPLEATYPTSARQLSSCLIVLLQRLKTPSNNPFTYTLPTLPRPRLLRQSVRLSQSQSHSPPPAAIDVDVVRRRHLDVALSRCQLAAVRAPPSCSPPSRRPPRSRRHPSTCRAHGLSAL